MSIVNLAEKGTVPVGIDFDDPFIVLLGHGPTPVHGGTKSSWTWSATLRMQISTTPLPPSPHLIAVSATTISMIEPLLGVENAVSKTRLLFYHQMDHDPALSPILVLMSYLIGLWSNPPNAPFTGSIDAPPDVPLGGSTVALPKALPAAFSAPLNALP